MKVSRRCGWHLVHRYSDYLQVLSTMRAPAAAKSFKPRREIPRSAPSGCLSSSCQLEHVEILLRESVNPGSPALSPMIKLTQTSSSSANPLTKGLKGEEEEEESSWEANHSPDKGKRRNVDAEPRRPGRASSRCTGAVPPPQLFLAGFDCRYQPARGDS